MGGPWWRRARHEWRPEDLPQIRVRHRGVGERGSSGGAANLGISRSAPATGKVRLASTIEQPGKLKVWITCSDGRETSV